MKNRSHAAAIVLLFSWSVLAGCATLGENAGAPIGAELLGAGIFEMEKGASAPGAAGLSVIHGAKLVESKDRVPASLGIAFGLSFRLTGGKPGEAVDLVTRILPPRAIKVPGSDQPQYTLSFTRKEEVGGDIWRLFTFEALGELAPGEWTFQVLAGKRKVLEKTFVVFLP